MQQKVNPMVPWREKRLGAVKQAKQWGKRFFFKAIASLS